MILILKYLVVFAFSITAFSEQRPPPFDTATGSVVLVIEGIESEKAGWLSAGIFTQEFFPEIGKASYERYVQVNGNTMEIRFDEIAVGNYAAAVFHDLDNNRKLRTNILGLPREPLGFSRDARIRMGPPLFKDAVFRVNAGETITLTIILR